MNILFTTSAAPSESPFFTSEKRPPLGILSIAACLEDHKIFLIDRYLKPDEYIDNGFLEKNKIDIVGIYSNTICFRDTLLQIWKLEYRRRLGWKGKIVVGGPHATLCPESIPYFVDHVVIGEGEEAMMGIVSGKITDRIVKCSPIEDLDMLPPPRYDLVWGNSYIWTSPFFSASPVITMSTSRGCPFSCSFCSGGALRGDKYTCFSAERVVRDIEELVKKYKIKGVYFREDNFTCNQERLRKFCKLLIKSKVNVQWCCETRADAADKPMLKLMYASGCRGVYVGVESGSKRILDRLNKKIKKTTVRTFFKTCKEVGIKTAASMLFGTPGENDTDLKYTSQFIQQLGANIQWNNVYVGIPGSELYKSLEKNKHYAFRDDRGILYLKGHDDRVKRYYKGNASYPQALIPYSGNPEVSILLVTQNNAEYIEEAVKGLLAQSFQNFELIIINDASTDNTLDLLQSFQDLRIRIIINKTSIGIARSRNEALGYLRGKYIACHDGDDVSVPYRLAEQVRFLNANPAYGLLGTPYYVINKNSKITGVVRVPSVHEDIYKGLMNQNWFGHGTVMLRTSVFEKVGGYNEDFKYAQDYDLWLRISEVSKVRNFTSPMYLWRQTTSGITSKNSAEQAEFAVKARSLAKARRRK